MVVDGENTAPMCRSQQVADVYELSHDTKRIRLSLGSPTTTLGSLATEAG